VMFRNHLYRGIICILASALSLGWFIQSVQSSDSWIGLTGFICLSLILLCSFWMMYSYFISRITDSDFIEVLSRDAVTYSSLILLSLFPLASILKGDVLRATLHGRFLMQAFLITFCFALVIFLKILFLDIRKINAVLHNGGSNTQRLLDLLKSPLILAIIMVVFTVYSTYLLSIEYSAFSEYSHYYHNIVWLLTRGSFTHTLSDLDIPTSVFGTHVNPILFLLVPFYALFQDVHTLFLLQSFLISLGAVPVYMLAKKVLNSDFAGITFSVAYLLHPVLGISHSWGITVDTISVPLVLFALYFLFTEQTRKFFLFTLLFLMCKEVLAAIVFALGLYILLVMRKRTQGILVSLMGILWFLIAAEVKTVAMNGVNMASAYQEALQYFIVHPISLLKNHLAPKKIMALTLLFSPMGYLCLARPLLLGVSFPLIFILFLRENSASPWIFYYAPVLPFVLTSAILGVQGLVKGKWLNTKIGERHLVTAVSFYLLFSSIISFYYLNPIRLLSIRSPSRFKVAEHNLTIREMFQLVPQDASVSVSQELASHFAKRKVIYHFFAEPHGRAVSEEKRELFDVPVYRYPEVRDAEYVVLDVNLQSLESGASNRNLQKMLCNEDYGMIAYREGFMIFKKGASKTLLDWVLVGNPDIENGNEIIFGGGLKLLGYNTDKRVLKQTATLHLTYFWECLGDTQERFEIATSFTHKGEKAFEWVHEPVYGLLPTTSWRKGWLVRDEVAMKVPENAITGVSYDVKVELHKLSQAEPLENVAFMPSLQNCMSP